MCLFVFCFYNAFSLLSKRFKWPGFLIYSSIFFLLFGGFNNNLESSASSKFSEKRGLGIYKRNRRWVWSRAPNATPFWGHNNATRKTTGARVFKKRTSSDKSWGDIYSSTSILRARKKPSRTKYFHQRRRLRRGRRNTPTKGAERGPRWNGNGGYRRLSGTW